MEIIRQETATPITFWHAIENGAVIGYIGIYRDGQSKTIFISDYAICPLRHPGVGKLLLERAIAETNADKTVENIHIIVLRPETQDFDLYHKLGFLPISR